MTLEPQYRSPLYQPLSYTLLVCSMQRMNHWPWYATLTRLEPGTSSLKPSFSTTKLFIATPHHRKYKLLILFVLFCCIVLKINWFELKLNPEKLILICNSKWTWTQNLKSEVLCHITTQPSPTPCCGLSTLSKMLCNSEFIQIVFVFWDLQSFHWSKPSFLHSFSECETNR